MMTDVGPGLFAGDFVAGDVVFTSSDDDGETTGLADEQLEHVRSWLSGKAVIGGDMRSLTSAKGGGLNEGGGVR